ncbi:Rha family transcriptional regulator [Desulfovibrio sp.]|uniref:Rha family transcriptional regulator n=1 Tax=Desulfovibrio sp. TaxID=885 RepID=UPI003D13FF1C
MFTWEGKPTVTSLQVAEAFGKEHDKVLRDIRNLSVSKSFIAANFGANEYIDPIGRSLPMYRLTRDGFMILARWATEKIKTPLAVAQGPCPFCGASG